jgi:hypothetical protein
MFSKDTKGICNRHEMLEVCYFQGDFHPARIISDKIKNKQPSLAKNISVEDDLFIGL